MNDNDRQPQCPKCYRRLCVVWTKDGYYCNKCKAPLHPPTHRRP